MYVSPVRIGLGGGGTAPGRRPRTRRSWPSKGAMNAARVAAAARSSTAAGYGGGPSEAELAKAWLHQQARSAALVLAAWSDAEVVAPLDGATLLPRQDVSMQLPLPRAQRAPARGGGAGPHQGVGGRRRVAAARRHRGAGRAARRDLVGRRVCQKPAWSLIDLPRRGFLAVRLSWVRTRASSSRSAAHSSGRARVRMVRHGRGCDGPRISAPWPGPSQLSRWV